MQALAPIDQLFLLIERRQQPMHVAGLQLFSFPEDAGDDYVHELAERMRSYHKAERPFNLRLVSRFGRSYWDAAGDIDLEHHFRREALPYPGRIRELLALVSSEHSDLLDRDRPLWEVHLIEGLKDRKFALYTKIHHSVVDGISAMRLGMRALSSDPKQRDMPPSWATPPRKRDTEGLPSPNDLATTLARLTSDASKQLATLPALVREIFNIRSKAKATPEQLSLYEAPRCVLNERITGSRRFAAQSYPIARMRTLAKAFDCTVNDIVLAVCSGALREYLLSLNALPAQPLIAMVPMSLRRDDSIGGNQLAMILANLGTHIADPEARMRVIRASVNDGKERYAQMTQEQAINFGAVLLAPTILNATTGISPKSWLAFNVVISNVPGPKEPLYWNGARLEGMYPVSIVLDHMALNFTLTSYADSLEFGIVACRRTLPSMQRMLEHVENALTELERVGGLPS